MQRYLRKILSRSIVFGPFCKDYKNIHNFTYMRRYQTLLIGPDIEVLCCLEIDYYISRSYCTE